MSVAHVWVTADTVQGAANAATISTEKAISIIFFMRISSCNLLHNHEIGTLSFDYG
jgi:hypothetical protein